jgi:drug/metabolite transporter (DMT)-like permease
MTSIRAEDGFAERASAQAARAHHADIPRVLLWMFGALLCFSAMAVSVRELSRALNLFEILAIRNAGGLLILGGALLVRPSLRHGLTSRHLPLHVVRNVVHFAGQYAWALALTLLPLATVFALEFTMPAWTVLLAVLWLGERLTPSRIGTVVLGFLGVLVILRPGLESFRPAALLVLAAAFGFAITLTITKKLTASVSTFAILFWMNVIQLPLGLAGSDLTQLANVHGAQYLAVLGLALAGTASHWCLSNAFRAGDAILVVPLDFLRIPLIAVVGWAFYGEALDAFVFAGAGLIVSGVLWNLVSEARRGAGVSRP